jgi:hypothetical protein
LALLKLIILKNSKWPLPISIGGLYRVNTPPRIIRTRYSTFTVQVFPFTNLHIFPIRSALKMARLKSFKPGKVARPEVIVTWDVRITSPDNLIPDENFCYFVHLTNNWKIFSKMLTYGDRILPPLQLYQGNGNQVLFRLCPPVPRRTGTLSFRDPHPLRR